jgi:ubiquinone/menaquinone biosynthesis C-methylase UbiE
MDKSIRFWDRAAEKYARSTIKNMPVYERKLGWTREHLTLDSTVLEYGSGSGSTALLHAEHVRHIVALDSSSAMTAIALEKAAKQGVDNVEFLTGTILDTTLPDASFDAVLALNVLHLIPQWEASIARSYALLKPGGVFISGSALIKEIGLHLRLLIPIARLFGKAPEVVAFTKSELLRALTDVGFEIALNESPGSKVGVFIVARKPA